MRGFNDFTSEIDRQIDRQASIPPVAGLVLAVSAAAGGIYFLFIPFKDASAYPGLPLNVADGLTRPLQNARKLAGNSRTGK